MVMRLEPLWQRSCEHVLRRLRHIICSFKEIMKWKIMFLNFLTQDSRSQVLILGPARIKK